ncbi:MAG: NAD(P)-dependent oxidoreductase [Elusimicrobia bacterium]|nr:NAD(P)-dependent oxidoreductase [Elusimicrobiota bacterium]
MNSGRELILMTGSSGLIGYPLSQRLSEEYQTVGFDRAGPPHPPPSVDCVAFDLGSDDSVRQAMSLVRERYGERIASVIHLAAYYDFSGESSPQYEKITVRGTERLLRALRPFHVEQFIFASTMLVHAPCRPGERIDENWPIKPKWAYPLSKDKAERLLLKERGDVPAVLFRISGVYDDACHSLPLAHQIRRIYERMFMSYLFPGNLSHGQSFMHLDDLVDAFVSLVKRRAQLPPELPLLIGEPDTLSYGTLQQAIGRLIYHEPWKTYRIPKTLAKAGISVQTRLLKSRDVFIKPWMADIADDHYALDITRARRLLGWEPKRSLAGTLPKMISFLKEDPPRWYEENGLEPPSWLKKKSRRRAVPASP